MLKKLEWESRFFDLECAQLEKDAGELIDERMFGQYDWIQAKNDLQDWESIRQLERMGFHFEDLRMTFSKRPVNNDPDTMYQISIAEEKEMDSIVRIAESAFTDHSRFLNLIGPRRTADFYATWAKNAVLGQFDDICLMIKAGQTCAGFVTLGYMKTGAFRIGLIGVASEYRHTGIGSHLIKGAEKWAIENDRSEIMVATEGRNLKAQRFYIRSGFNIETIECWHYWRRS